MRTSVQIASATTLAGVVADAPVAERERVARGLRGARTRTGLNERQVVALLTAKGVAVNLALLRRAERTGSIDLALAACLADTYGTTIDGLAGRRFYRRAASPPL